jgi:hypothetical protein
LDPSPTTTYLSCPTIKVKFFGVILDPPPPLLTYKLDVVIDVPKEDSKARPPLFAFCVHLIPCLGTELQAAAGCLQAAQAD